MLSEEQKYFIVSGITVLVSSQMWKKASIASLEEKTMAV